MSFPKEPFGFVTIFGQKFRQNSHMIIEFIIDILKDEICPVL